MTISVQHFLTKLSAVNRSLSLAALTPIWASVVFSGQAAAESKLGQTVKDGVVNFAKQWVAESEGIRADEVQFLPIDDRLDLQHCSVNALEIDLPFGSSRTLRLRCGEGGQQVFLHRSDLPAAGLVDKVSAHKDLSGPVTRSESLFNHGSSVKQTPTPSKPIGLQTRVGVTVQTVLVATSPLLTNQPLSAPLFRAEKREVFGNSRQFVQSVSELPFLELLRPLKAGEVLKQRDTRKARLVRKGTPVQFQFVSNPSIRLQAELQAMEDGFFGDKIRLKNPESGRIIMGLVTNRGEARSF